MAEVFIFLAGISVFAAGFYAGRLYHEIFDNGRVYKKEYGRTNGLYEPIRRD
jgi:hypothetical protein